jgi:serine/threonine-protein kinase
MGAVYEIEHELTKHRRALKLLHASMAAVPGVVERFLREASAAGRVGNPHIVESFDAGRLDTGEPYLVLEMLRGETLTDRISRGPMPIGEMVDLVGQACDGIQAAHDAGIVHRDLKPDNLFVTDVNLHAFVKILDFGISKFDPSKTGGGMQLTQEGAALGTPYYMSPEQVLGLTNLDARSDVYALGVILYECAAGARPFEAETLPQLVVMIHEGRPQPLGERRPDLPAAFVDLVHRAMAKDRDQRVQTARDLRSELQRFGGISVDTHMPLTRSGDAPAPPTEAPNAFGHRPVPSVVAAQSAVTEQGLATSAAGVSIRTSSTAPKKSHTGVLVGAGLGVAVLLGGSMLALRSGHTTDAAESAAAEPAAAPAPVAPQAGNPTHVIEPLVPTDTASAAPSAAPPTLAPAPKPAAQNSPSPQTSPPAPAPTRKLRRADQTGLAKENPFK